MAMLWAVIASVIVSLVSLVGIFTFLFKEQFLNKILILLVAFAAGALIGAAFLHLLPEALEKSNDFSTYIYLLASFLLFFILERFLRWRHCHDGYCDIHPFSYLSLIGDGAHNFFDGLVIGSSFVIDIRFGIITTVVILLHEVPQEFGDFGVLVYGGFNKWKALFYNFLSGITAILGAILGCYFSKQFTNFSQVILPFAAGGFIYIAGCDLIPEIHKESDLKKATLSMSFFILGIVFMFLAKLMH